MLEIDGFPDGFRVAKSGILCGSDHAWTRRCARRQEHNSRYWFDPPGRNPRGTAMRNILVATVLVAIAVPAAAQQQQQQQPANRDANTPAINSPNSPPNPAAPVAGANSFTEGQAKSRLETNGFSNVSGLNKDANGVWRGKASKGGQTVDVSVDFQGNVTPR
jgi:hypothetical protein